ncbi:MAG: hypothetical protein Q8R53_03765 [Nanoarchaeota archaeon]|nr:hypothetical protein [Nanoarchaeota archaeon]
MPRGRPPQSEIRKNVIELLFQMKKGYGYQIAKFYNEIFPQVTQRSIYYHLRKGVQLKEFVVHKIEEERGDFSWGSIAEKIYYSVGPQAQPKGDSRVAAFLTQWQKPNLKEKFTRFVGKFRKEKSLPINP